MLYNRRQNLEINNSMIPKGWEDEGDRCKRFTFYPSAKELRIYKVRFFECKEYFNQKELFCFLLSNYIAFHRGKNYQKIAMDVFCFSRNFNPSSCKPESNFSPGSFPELFHAEVKSFCKNSEIRSISNLMYLAFSGFIYSPVSLRKKLCRCIYNLKYPPKIVGERRLHLSTCLSIPEYERFHIYTEILGLSINELLKGINRTFFVSKKERVLLESDGFSRVFSLYRILKQPYIVTSKRGGRIQVSCFIYEPEAQKYVSKILKRRKISASVLLKKAVYAFFEVMDKKDKFLKKIVLPESDEEMDYTESHYLKMSRKDFVYSIYK